MKRANSQEPKSEISHSCFSGVMAFDEQAPSGSTGRSKSVAMLGLALSFGASGVLFADGEATASVGSFVATSSATSSEVPQLPSILGHRLNQSLDKEPAATVYHTVERGDSLWHIAHQHQVEIQDIKQVNRISPDEPLQVGQVIKVPGDEGSTPTLVSLLPGVKTGADTPAPSLERLLATLPDAGNDVAIKVESSDLSSSVEEPTVVATEELTGDVSLRSAGLVSQADGLQADLQALASRNQSVENVAVKDSTQAEANVAVAGAVPVELPEVVPESSEIAPVAYGGDVTGYEVRPGDTVEDIAFSLGTTPEEIATTNQLEDPDFIIAGETLAVPASAEAVSTTVVETDKQLVQVPPELTAAAPGVGGFDGTRLARLQATVERQVDVSSTLSRLRTGEVELDASSQDASEAVPEAATLVVEDPYTADLIADVNSAQQLNMSADDSTEVVALQSSTVSEPIVVNPQFPGVSAEADVDAKRYELFAAAPLDPSVYVSTPSPEAGQVVSPEMPILPSADEYLPESPDYFNGYIWPTHGTLTSGYGWRWGRMHRGIDVAGPVGTPIVAAAAGVVERAGWNSGGYGNLVEVRHADGSMTRYAHNSRIVVQPGQRVSQGQHIADMGSTGYSTGPHLHFEVHIPNQGTVNPMAMLPGR